MIDRVFLKKYSVEQENYRFYEGFVSFLYKDNKKEITIQKYSFDLEKFLIYLNDNNLYALEVYEYEIEEYFFYLQRSGVGKESILRRFSSMSGFYKYLIKQGWIEENPMAYLKKGKYDRCLLVEDNILDEKQIRKVRAKLRSSHTFQARAYFELSVSSGIKSHCVPDLKWSQVDFENRKIVNIREKRDKVTTIYFSERVRDELIQLKESRTEKELEFGHIFKEIVNGRLAIGGERVPKKISMGSLRKYAKSYGGIVGKKDFTPFNLTLTCANLLMLGGMSAEDGSFILNHRTDAGSVIYEQKEIEPILKQKDDIESNFERR